MPPWTQIPAYGHGGIVVVALAVSAAALLLRAPAYIGSKGALYALVAAAGIPVAVELVLTTWYLFSPTFIDHIEASTASVTQYFRQGLAVYPDLGSYTFHGLLYGPLLAEVSSLGYLVGSGVFAAKLIGWVAAWVAVGLLFALPGSPDRRWPWAVGIASVLCVWASFGSVLTADRADPLLILFATVGFICVLRSSGSLMSLAVAAMLAGAAADLKLHGPVYLAPALYWWAWSQLDRRLARWLLAVAVTSAAFAIGIVLPFLPGNVVLGGYLGYLGLAAKHGLVWTEFGWNAAFLAGLWAPVGVAFAGVRSVSKGVWPFAAVLLALEMLVAIIAAKPGAGIHHLLPFMCYHAFLLQQILAGALDEPRALLGATVALAIVLLGTAWPAAGIFRHLFRFDLQLAQQRATHAELVALAEKYSGAMIGVSDTDTYPLTSFRPWLTLRGARQTDYGALMDLRLSGVSDAPLARALARCEIPYLFMPSKGAPFSIPNRYGGPLFSDQVRTEFRLQYALLQTGTDFNVYGCRHTIEERPLAEVPEYARNRDLER